MDAYRTNGVLHDRYVLATDLDFYERYNDRGYTLEEVEPCIVEKHDGMVLIDTIHESYPSVDRTAHFYRPVEHTQEGAGSELKKLLSKVGIKSSPNCNCNMYAAWMNHMGTDWCTSNIDEIVSWLGQEAKKRGLPFVKMVAKQVVKMAINRAIKKENGNENI